MAVDIPQRLGVKGLNPFQAMCVGLANLLVQGIPGSLPGKWQDKIKNINPRYDLDIKRVYSSIDFGALYTLLGASIGKATNPDEAGASIAGAAIGAGAGVLEAIVRERGRETTPCGESRECGPLPVELAYNLLVKVPTAVGKSFYESYIKPVIRSID